MVLAHELVRFASGFGRPDHSVRGGLAARQQRVVSDHIEEHLAERMSLKTLARLVDLSPFHFSRAFKQSFGMPPLRFYAHRRIERAKVLLLKYAMSGTEVGTELGFCESSAFSRSFRKVTGLTPTGFRRNHP